LAMTRKKILWLVSWYPNKTDLFDGDFIQRHAKAAARWNDIHVLFIRQSENQDRLEQEWKETDHLTEQIIYLPKKKGPFGKWKNHREWKRVYKQQLAQLINKWRPELIHVHVPWKVGLMALWAKEKYKIPFLITEHWGIYNKVAGDNIHRRSFLFRKWLRRFFEEASSFLSVSKFLAEAVNRSVVERSYQVIPNVVDTDFFFLKENSEKKFRFIHVSNMVALKNIGGILEAGKILSETNQDFELVMVGNKDHHWEGQVNEHSLNELVFFRGEVSYPQVAVEMQRANAFILFSDIENSPCVISEALCCGLPVIATNVGGIPELVNNENGILLEPGNSKVLAEAMLGVMKKYEQFDRKRISQLATEKFNYSAVGKMFDQAYDNLLK